MNRLLIHHHELDANSHARVGGRRAKHLIEILKVEPGRQLRAGLINGSLAEAEVLAVGSDWVEVEVISHGESLPDLGIDLVLALPRPKYLSRILRQVAMLGIGKVDLINAWRVDKSYFDSPRLEQQRMREDLIGGLEQGGGTTVPEVTIHRLMMPFIEALPKPADDRRQRLIGHPRAEDFLESVSRPRHRRLIAIGPEGGWIGRELASFEELGFTPVCLSQVVLDCLSVLPALVTQIEMIDRWE